MCPSDAACCLTIEPEIATPCPAVDVQIETILKAADVAETSVMTREAIAADPLVILRVATVVAGCAMPPIPAVTSACKGEIARLHDADLDAVREELTACLLGRDVDSALEWLSEIGFLEEFFPELEATRNLKQEPGRHHKDVWEHTKLVVKQAVPRPVVRWSALLHDIGKVPTRRFTKNGVHFHGHAEVGARMFDKMCKRFPFPEDLRKPVRFLIKHHLRSAQYEDDWTDSAVRRFAREMEAHMTDLLDLSRADITSKRPGRRRSLLFQISALADRIDTLAAEDAVVPPLPKGLGTRMMSHFGLPPSKRIGDLKKELEAKVESGEIKPHQDESYYIEVLETMGLEKA